MEFYPLAPDCCLILQLMQSHRQVSPLFHVLHLCSLFCLSHTVTAAVSLEAVKGGEEEERAAKNQEYK